MFVRSVAVRGALLGIALLMTGAGVGMALAQEQVLNLYSSRHYQTDEALYEDFTRQTGIVINRLEADGSALLERLKNEGENSPADILITVDVGRLWAAESAGLFGAVESEILKARIPAHLRHPDGLWFGFSTRARVIIYNRDLVDPAGLTRYQDLADPRWRGQVCIRSSGNIYNLSLLASMIAHLGAEKAEEWARGVVANFARDPQGGDTDQIRSVASGECSIAVANTYYYARLLRSEEERDKEVVARTGVIFPDQDGRGTHVNVSGAGMIATAPNRENAVRFLEYLVSDTAQRYFADANNEYPAVENLLDSPALEQMGAFREDQVNVSVLGLNQAEAQRVFDRAGWR